MKKSYQKDLVARAISKSRYRQMLESLPVHLFVIEYEAGELVSSPDTQSQFFQIIVSGSIQIYYIRSDGSRYSLSVSERDGILGETAFFREDSREVFAEASERTVCLAFDIRENRSELLANAELMRILAESLTGKIEAIMLQNTALSLQERVLSYMRYRCENGNLKGVEQAAFQLHCSPRQLQRILNGFEADGSIRKTGKGSYVLESDW